MIWLYLPWSRSGWSRGPRTGRSGQIAEGAGELGFFPPQSKWPLFLSRSRSCPSSWLRSLDGGSLIIGFGFGFITLTGLMYEFYRGDHAH